MGNAIIYKGGVRMVSTVMTEIQQCLKEKQNFLLSGGAGSGKTHTLIETLHVVFSKNPNASVACITYTNVAVKEIRERSPYSKLQVSTIHQFLWEEIKSYQNNLKKTILSLVEERNAGNKSGLLYSGEEPLTEKCLEKIVYASYQKLEEGKISHDDIFKIAEKMFSSYPLLSKITADKYDYIFIDEYQDTQSSVIKIFLEHLLDKKSLCIRFFGDSMQGIYDTGIGDITKYIDSGNVQEIIKPDNYRCSVAVIGLLNKIRSDIEQKASKKNRDGNIFNQKGSASFLYSMNEFDLDTFKNCQFSEGWDFTNISETRVLYLTHKLNAKQIGFYELLTAYNYSDNIIGNNPDRFSKHLLKVGGILSNYKQKNFSDVIEEIDSNVTGIGDKKRISSLLNQILSQKNSTIDELLEIMHKEKLAHKDSNLVDFLNKNEEFYEKVQNIDFFQVVSYYDYYNNESPYSTQHGIKGAEFNDVVVVLDNGNWNKYNFKYYFEKNSLPDKERIIQRTKKIFYVCCSRAKNNLVVYCQNPTPSMKSTAIEMFGEKNVHELIK